MPTNSSIKSGRVTFTKRKVKNMKNVPDEDGNDVFYIVNFEEGGFVIMSGDRRINPVLAYSLTGNFKFDSNTFPSGLNSWLSSTKDYVKYVRKNKDKFKVNEKVWKEKIIEKIVGGFSNKSQRISAVPVDPPTECNDILTVVNPLISTNWGQGVGYNNEIERTGCSNYSNGHAPTGCVATAMAQVMNFHRKPSQYSWDSMQPNSFALTTLMKVIGQKVGMVYACDGSSANTQNEVASSFVEDFQYSSAQYSSYNQSTVVSELNNGKPVILRGSSQSGFWGSYVNGHAWVCDGYRQHYFCEAGVTFLLLHMNWGWDGEYNGLYSFNNFNPDDYTFNYQTGMIYNIRP